MTRRLLGGVMAVLIPLVPHTSPIASAGQQAGAADAYRALVSARSFKCTFPSYTTVDWDSDEPTIRTDRQDFGFQIDGIDFVKRTARIIGNAGADDLAVTKGEVTISFIEQVPSGTLNVTTVYAWRDKLARFKAVHSRHFYSGVVAPGLSIGSPAPSQTYGYCQIWD